MDNDLKNILVEADRLNNQGKNKEAKELYLKILTQYPDHPDVNHNLSILLIREKKFQEAKFYIEKFLSSDFPMAEYYNTAGRYYLMINEIDLAINILEKSINLDENDVKPIYLKAIALRQKNEPGEALKFFKKSYEIQSNTPEIINSYGVALASVERYEESLKYYYEALKIDPNFFDSLLNLALSLQKTSKFVESKKNYEKALGINPNNYYANLNFASMYQALGNKEKTIEYYSKARQINPNDSDLYNNLATAYGEFGEKELAEEMYKKSLEINPENFKVYRHYATTGLLTKKSEATKKMLSHYGNNKIQLQDKAELGYALGFIYDKEKEYSKAFSYIKKANDFYEKKNKYNIENVESPIAKMKDIVKKNEISFCSNEIDISPIFIVGMPRSGTTMLERIISNNDEVSALGELTTIPDLALSLRKKELKWPEVILSLNEDDYNGIREKYIKSIKQISPNIRNRFVDKMPYNFLFIGLIRSLFPSSKIINITRDSRDTCLSIFMLKLFGTHMYSHNLINLGKYYNIYFNLMNFWNEIFPEDMHSVYESIYNIQYENLVSDTVEQTKKIMDYCELEYKKDMERFDLNKNTVRTASNHQVREKINSSSINRWKNYEDEIYEFLNVIDKRTFFNS